MNGNKIREIRQIRENPRFRPYPEYKGSGVEWIGRIPHHWKKSRLKYESLVPVQYGLNINSDLYVEEGVRFIRTTDITDDGDLIDDGVYLETGSVEKIYLTQPNDFLISRSGTLGRTYLHLSDEKYTYGGYLVRFNFRCSVKSRFIFYFTRSQCFANWIALNTVQSTIGNVNGQKYSNLEIPIPSSSEQTQIADFLDRKTEQIDELIRIKERRIELLQEQRTVLINQVVTKGLDPNVEMKPSGAEWIGEIPAHWKVKRLKHVAEILPSNVDKHIYPNEIQVRLCNYTDVYYNDYITVDTVLAKGSCKEREFAKFALRKGDVIITKDSETPDDIGVPTFVKDDLENVVCGYHLTMVRPLACHEEFIFRFIQSDRTRRYFELESNGITRYGLGKASIENLFLPLPTDSEQRQIANFLDRKTKQIDKLIATEQRKIELLKEYRQSLISEAVTGKIDVRNEG
ncbi:MAG: restriction endonuclease subunit S [Candidatus Poribacteria bacterium]|nr:restriction endonuclease subunit S [Candidatus Poribacteria bacterium]